MSEASAALHSILFSSSSDMLLLRKSGSFESHVIHSFVVLLERNFLIISQWAFNLSRRCDGIINSPP